VSYYLRELIPPMSEYSNELFVEMELTSYENNAYKRIIEFLYIK